MQNKIPKEVKYADAVRLSPLSEKTIEDRFYGKYPEKWGVYKKVKTTTLKVVSRDNFKKFFLKKMSGKRNK